MTTEKNEKKSSSLLSYMTPARSVKRALSSVVHSKDQISLAIQAMGQSLPGQPKDGRYEEGDVRNIKDPSLRYKAMYELHSWTEADILKQISTLRTTKFVAFVFAILSFFFVIFLATTMPIWLSLVLVPVSGSSLILGVSQGFKYALYEAQIKLESFISAREFVSREDFWQRLFG